MPVPEVGGCAVRRQLAIAARHYYEAVVRLTLKPEAMSHRTYRQLSTAAWRALEVSESAERTYDEHIAAHHCDIRSSRSAAVADV
jgi:hypothetical protein